VKAVHGIDPSLHIGGPNLQDAVSDTWLDDALDHSWTRRFLTAIRAPDRRTPLDFFSFEHNPFDALCGALDRKLLDATGILAADMARLRADGVPAQIPWIITEYGFSAFSGQGQVEVPGALFDADMVAHFLALGGRSTYLLGYGPDSLYEPERSCRFYPKTILCLT